MGIMDIDDMKNTEIIKMSKSLYLQTASNFNHCLMPKIIKNKKEKKRKINKSLVVVYFFNVFLFCFIEHYLSVLSFICFDFFFLHIYIFEHLYFFLFFHSFVFRIDSIYVRFVFF